jgi:hypothetical protein
VIGEPKMADEAKYCWEKHAREFQAMVQLPINVSSSESIAGILA